MSMNPIERLRDLERRAEEGGGAERLKKQHDAGKLTARERVEMLFDPGTFEEVDKLVHPSLPRPGWTGR
jgi:propionyl-CoA carboxylase beta chain